MPARKRRDTKSAFGLFVTKMKMIDKSLCQKRIAVVIEEVNPMYLSLDPEVKQKFNDLSAYSQQNGLRAQEIAELLKDIDITGDTPDDELDGELDDQGDADYDDSVDQSVDDKMDVVIGCHQLPLITNAITASGHIGFDRNHRCSAIKPVRPYDSDSDFDAIKQMLQKLSPIDLKRKTIICMTFNVAVADFEGNYYPNEVGFTQFTLESGVQKSYHRFIRNTFPSGYYAMAKELSENVHKIPFLPKDTNQFSDDYQQITREMQALMSASTIFTPDYRKVVFYKSTPGADENRKKVLGCLKWLEDQWQKEFFSSSRLFKNFIVADLSELLFLMSAECCNNPRPKHLCVNVLNSCQFDYLSELFCDFHREPEVPACALSASLRMAYLFIGSLFALHLKPEIADTIKAVPGRHAPPLRMHG